MKEGKIDEALDWRGGKGFQNEVHQGFRPKLT